MLAFVVRDGVPDHRFKAVESQSFVTFVVAALGCGVITDILGLRAARRVWTFFIYLGMRMRVRNLFSRLRRVTSLRYIYNPFSGQP